MQSDKASETNLREYATALHNRYLPLRNTNVPFPFESVAFWCFAFGLQKELEIAGDILEVGVEHGGTAFLSVLALTSDEKIRLVDLKKSPLFEEKFKLLPEEAKAKVHFYEGNSQVLCQTNDVISGRKYRFVHIDAGHQKQDVVKDIETISPLLAVNGLLCLDDVFEIRWPGVTEAVIETLPKTDLTPVAMVNRKLYTCRSADRELYFNNIQKLSEAISMFGSFRIWTEEFLGVPIIIIKLNYSSAGVD